MDDIDDIIIRQIDLVLMEDIGPGDLTSLACVEPAAAVAEIIAKSDGILAGLPVVEATFTRLDDTMKMISSKNDGDSFSAGEIIIRIEGDNRSILGGERAALNFLGHLSGIATLAGRFVSEIEGTGAKILDTRKTTPGLRYLEKYAVSCGGGTNHRLGLYDMALIKDNHIAACGSIGKAVERMKEYLKSNEFMNIFKFPAEEVEIEVEVTNVDQLKEAIECGISWIMLDNQSPEKLTSLVQKARSLSDNLRLEASGNVSLKNVRQVAESGVDFISIGALTHSAPASDFSLKYIS